MKLFRESARCRACGHQWTGYLHGFARGHAVLVSGNRVAFIPDDLLYAFPEQIGLEHDLAQPLLALGWRHMESCPSCGARDFAAAYDLKTMRDVSFCAFDMQDFVLTAQGCALSERGMAKLQTA